MENAINSEISILLFFINSMGISALASPSLLASDILFLLYFTGDLTSLYNIHKQSVEVAFPVSQWHTRGNNICSLILMWSFFVEKYKYVYTASSYFHTCSFGTECINWRQDTLDYLEGEF